MPEAGGHACWKRPGARLWVCSSLADADAWERWCADGPTRLRALAEADGRVPGAGRGDARALSLHGLAAVWRHNRHGGWLGGVRGDAFLSPRRVAREVAVSEDLRERGVPTPRVLLALAWRSGGLWRQEVVTEEVPGAVTVFAAREDPRAVRAGEALLERCADVGLRAPDLHPANMLWQAAEQRCWVIDLAGARLRPAPLGARTRRAQRRRWLRYFHKHGGALPAALTAAGG